MRSVTTRNSTPKSGNLVCDPESRGSNVLTYLTRVMRSVSAQRRLTCPQWLQRRAAAPFSRLRCCGRRPQRERLLILFLKAFDYVGESLSLEFAVSEVVSAMNEVAIDKTCFRSEISSSPRVLRRAIVASILSTTSVVSYAASEEIQVYLDDLRAPGQLGVDVHNNFAASGRSAPDYPGEQAPGKVYRLTPEFAYGLTKTTEFGFYLLSTRDLQGNLHGDGVKARIKYVAPHDLESGPFWGVNLEVGRSSRRVSETPWNTEIKGILGFRTDRWTLAINPNLDWSLSHGGGPVTGDVDLKANYAIDSKTQVGLESYNELGPLRHLSTSATNGRSVFAVVDKDFGKFDLNAGLGRGLSQAADKWVIKIIVGTNFN